MNRAFRLLLLILIALLTIGSAYAINFAQDVVSYYDLDDVTTDSTGTYNGTGTGSGVTTAGASLCKVGTCYGFNGTGGISLPSYANTFDGNSNYTVMFWAQTTSGAEQGVFSNRGNYNIYWGYGLGGGGGCSGDYGQSYFDGVVNRICTDSAIANKWHHVTIVYNTDYGVRAYLNGSRSNSVAGTYNPNSAANTNFIGGYEGTAQFFNGLIDELGVWSRPLTGEEINASFNSGSGCNVYDNPLGCGVTVGGNFTVNAQDAYDSSSITTFNVTFEDLGITTTQKSYNHTTDFSDNNGFSSEANAVYNSSVWGYQFNGVSNRYVNLNNAIDFETNDFKINITFTAENFTGTDAVLLSRWGTLANYNLRLVVIPNTGKPSGYINLNTVSTSGDACSASGGTVNWGVTYNVVATHTPSNCTIVLNEVLVATDTSVGQPRPVSTTTVLGKEVRNGRYFNGTILHAQIWQDGVEVLNMPFINFSTEPSTFDYSGQGTITTTSNLTYHSELENFQYNSTTEVEYMRLNPIVELGTNDFSISFWYRFTNFTTTHPRMFRTDGGPVQNEIYFNTGTNGWRLILDNGTTNNDGTRCATGFSMEGWHHVLFTVDRSGNAQCYINATASGSPYNIGANLQGNITGGNNKMYLGATQAGGRGSNYFTGYMNQFRIYDEVLDSSEITAVYNNESINANAWYILTAQNSTVGDVTVNGVPNYFGNTTNNVNTSQTLTTKHTRHPFVLFYDAYTGLNISSFNVTINATTYTTTNGTLYIPYKDLVGTSSANKYFQSSNTISNRTEYLAHYASITGFNAYDKVSGANVSTFTVNTTSEGGSATNTSYLPSLYTTYGNFTAELNKGGYYQSFTTYEANPQTSQTANFTVYNHKANFTINIGIGGSTDQNFTITIYDRNNYSYTETRNTTTGSITFNLSHGNFTAYINDSIHTLTNYNFTLNNGNNLSNFTITTYTTNTVNITFLDEETNRLITQADQNSTVTAYITGSAASYNFTTNTGSIQAEMINPQSYVVTYSADGYGQREKHFTLTNRTFEYLTLYLLNESTEDLILFTVRDAIGTNIENATVRAQRKNLSGTNYYEVDNCVTGTEGTCTMRLILYDPTYRFVVDYNDATVKTTGDQKITSTSVVITVDLTTDELAQIKSNLDVTGNVTYNNNTETFTFTWNNPAGTNVQGCMEVTARKAGIYTTLNNTNCGTSSSGSVTYTINESRYDEFTAKGYVTSDGITRLVDTYGLITGGFGTGAGANGLFIFGFFILGTLAMAMLWNPIAAPIVLVGGLALFSFAGIISIPLASIGGLIALVIGFIALSNR